jgi:hypothetical protein
MGAPAYVQKTLWYAIHAPVVATLICRNFLNHRCVQAARVYDLVRTKMMHVCNFHCTSNGRCKKGFPRPLHADENPSQDPETRRWRYHTEAASDQYIVPYHAICLALWRAHCAVLLICDEAWSTYVLKYVMKSDCAGELDISCAVLPGIMCLALDPVIAALVSAFSSTRFISPCQAGAVLAKIPLVQMPDTRYVPAYPPEESSSQRFPAHASALDIYQEREDIDEDVTFVAFHKKYTTDKSEAASPEVHCTIRSTAPTQRCRLTILNIFLWSGLTFCLCCTGKAHYLSRIPYVRFTHFHPVNECEAFCYNLLLSKIAFRHPGELFLPDRAPSYLQACKDRDIITDEASVLQVLEQYAADQMLGPTAALDLFQKFLTDHPLDEEPAQFSSHGSAQDKAAAYIAEMQTESAALDAYQLSAEQQHAIDQICSHPAGLHIISGIAGSGKTFVAQVRTHTCSCHQICS